MLDDLLILTRPTIDMRIYNLYSNCSAELMSFKFVLNVFSEIVLQQQSSSTTLLCCLHNFRELKNQSETDKKKTNSTYRPKPIRKPIHRTTGIPMLSQPSDQNPTVQEAE